MNLFRRLLPKPYIHLPGYLHRWVIFSFGRLSLRFHRFYSPDGTPFLHSHPFHYLSFVVRGGYTEQLLRDGELVEIEHTAPTFIFRSSSDMHRIAYVKRGCSTLFLSVKVNGRWRLARHEQINPPVQYQDYPDGLYKFEHGYRKRENGFWFKLESSPLDAVTSNTLSVHQVLKPLYELNNPSKEITHGLV